MQMNTPIVAQVSVRRLEVTETIDPRMFVELRKLEDQAETKGFYRGCWWGFLLGLVGSAAIGFIVRALL